MTNLIANPTGVSDLQNLADDTKIDFFVCRLAKVDIKVGKSGTYYNCRFEDPNNSREAVYGNAFIKYAPSPLVRKVVVVEGATKGTFNGRLNITVGKMGTIVEHREGASPSQSVPQRTASGMAPDGHGMPRNAPSAVSAPTGGHPVHGATVGGALARAVDIWLASNPSGWNADSVAKVEAITRDLVGIQQRIESGETSENIPF